MKQNKSVRKRIFFSYVISIILPLIIFSIIIYSWATSTIERQTRERYKSQLVEIANIIDNRFTELDKFVYEISGATWLKKIIYMRTPIERYDRIDYNVFLDYLNQFSLYNSINDFINEIGIYFNNKDLIMSSMGKDTRENFFRNSYKIKGMDVSDWEHILCQFHNKTIMPPLDASKYGSEFRSLTYIKTLPEVDNVPMATAIISVKEDTIKEMLSSIVTDDQISVYMFSGDDLVTSINQNDPVEKALSGKLNANTLKDAQKIGIQNMNYYTFLSSSTYTDWSYAAVIPSYLVLAQVNYVAKASIILILFFICVGFFIAYANSRKTYKSVDNIMKTIKNIVGGDDEASSTKNEYEAIENTIIGLFNKEQKLKQTFENNLPILRNSYILKILKGDFILNELFVKMLDFLDIRINNEFFTSVALIDTGNSGRSIEERLRNFIPDWNIYVVEDGFDIKSIVINSNKGSYSEIIHELYLALSTLIPYLTAGAGNTYTSIDKLSLSYREALNALNYKLLKGCSTIIPFEEIKDNNELYYYPRDKQDAIINCLKLCEPEKACSICSQIIDYNIASKKLNIEAAKSLFYNILITIFQILKDVNVGTMDTTMENKLFTLDSIYDIKRYLNEICHVISNKINAEHQKGQKEMTNNIIDDINSNYFSPDLTLSYLADKYSLTEPYLSTLLKKNLGCTFMDYITSKRVEMAKELLLKENLKITDICRMVGYESDLSFRRAFSKNVGVSPSQFKKLG